MLSDTDSSDSDNGVRFKTTSTRNREENSKKTDSATDDRSWRRNKDANNFDHRRSRERDTLRNRDFDRDRDTDRSRKSDLDRDRDRDSNRNRDRGLERSGGRDSYRERERERDREQDRYSVRDRKDRDYDKDKDAHRDRDNHHDRDRQYIRSRDNLQRSRSNEFRNSRDRASVKRSKSKDRARPHDHNRDDRPSSSSGSSKKIAEDRYSRNRSPLMDERKTNNHRNVENESRGSISSEVHSNSAEKKSGKRKSPSVEIVSDSNNINKADYRNLNDSKNSLLEINLQSEEKLKTRKSKHKKHKHKSKRDERNKTGIVEIRSNSLEDSTASSQLQVQGDKTPTYSKQESVPETSNETYETFGPSLPPHLMRKSPPSEKTLCPKPPPRQNESADRKRVHGPTLPDNIDLHSDTEHIDPVMSDISDDDDIIGPLPIGAGTSEAQLELEKRALELKLAKLNESERIGNNRDATREEWMTELPSVRSVAGLGLTARQFRTNERPDMSDRSSWTDTPKDRERKSHRIGPTTNELIATKRKEEEAAFRDQRDAEQEAVAKKHKKKHKRDESLLDIHQKKLKKKKEVIYQ